MKQKKERNEVIKELRCTMFEYSSSDSDDDNSKNKSNLLSFKKAKSTMNLPIQNKKKKIKKNICIFIEICSYDFILSPSNF